MTEQNNKADIRFKIDGQVLIFRNATIISDDNNLLTFIDKYDNRTKTYNKEFLISYEVLT